MARAATLPSSPARPGPDRFPASHAPGTSEGDPRDPSTRPSPPGTPCWVDLFTSDPERSQAFYAAVPGWEFADQGEELGGYVLATSGGAPLAGLMRNDAGSGSPDAWSTYLAIASVEESLTRATQAGATVLAPALRLGRLGTSAVLVDPAGAVVGLWEGGELAGFGRHGEPGSVVWSETHSKSFGASRDFYAAVSGWRYEVTGDDDFRYPTATVDGAEVVGVMDSARFLPDAVPSHWPSTSGWRTPTPPRGWTWSTARRC